MTTAEVKRRKKAEKAGETQQSRPEGTSVTPDMQTVARPTHVRISPK